MKNILVDSRCRTNHVDTEEKIVRTQKSRSGIKITLKWWADLLISESSKDENDGDDITKEPRQYARKLPKIGHLTVNYLSLSVSPPPWARKEENTE